MKTKQTDPYIGIRNFIEVNNLNMVGGPLIKCKAIIEYCFSGKSKIATGDITISVGSYDYGRIGIDSDKFMPETFHTEFSPRYQTIHYDASSNKLIIEGTSQKMGGAYKVSIATMS